MPDLLTLTDLGLYCADGDFYVDPWKPVPRAVVTHAHGDHLTRGCRRYLVAETSRHVASARLDDGARIQTLRLGERLRAGGVTLSFHPAGHIRGSAQVRIEGADGVWVVTGDFKTDPDPTCTPFEPVPCDVLVPESTFALPVYRWPDTEAVAADMRAWWAENAAAGRPSIVFAYALGKAQRVLAAVADDPPGPFFAHGAVVRMTDAYRASGVDLPSLTHALQFDRTDSDHRRGLVVAPPGMRSSPWMRRFPNAATAFASGWMRIRGPRRRRAVDRGFVLSDHADWTGLTQTVRETGASRILPTHGYTAVLARWAADQGLAATPLETAFTAGPEADPDAGLDLDDG